MDIDTENRKLETLAWGLLLIWLGVWWAVPGDSEIFPAGIGAIGVGAILLGLNLARWIKDIPINLCSTVLGITFFTLGGLELACGFLSFPSCEPSVLGILLISFGAVLLTRELRGIRKTGFEN